MAAKGAGGLIGWKADGGEQVAQQQPGAMACADQIAVFADPAQTSLFSPGLVHQRRAIDAGAPAAAWLLLVEPAAQSPQPLIHHPVVIAAPAVTGNFWGARGLLLVDVVVQCHGQHALHPRQQLFNRLPSGVLHPGHVRLVARR